MTPDTFLQNFKCVINAPSGLSRLREMIYALAIRGNLSQQLESDGTGHELLEDISAAKQDRIDAGTFKRSPKLESMDMIISDSVPRIPRTWAWSRLVDVGEINPRNEAEDHTLAAFAPMNVISEIHNRQVRCEERPWASIRKGFTHFADGDVMVAKITPCFENGKGAVLRGLKNGIGAGTTELHVVRPLPGMLPEFIYIFLRSPHFKIVGESHMTGTAGQKRLPTEYFALRQLPLPPLEEQKRIVAKVDELMRLCDRLEAQQQEREKLLPLLSRANHTRFIAKPTAAHLHSLFHQPRISSIEDLRNTILTLGVTGRLTQQLPDDESAAFLLDELREKQVVQHEMIVGRSRTTVSNAVLPNWATELPASWETPLFDDLLVITSGITKGRNLAGRRTVVLPYLRVANVQRWRLSLEHIKEIEVLEEERARYGLLRGDIVMVEGGDWDKVGRAAIWNEEIENCVFQNHIFRVRSPEKAKLLPEWVVMFVNSPLGREYFESCSKQTTNLASINMSQLRACRLPLPSTAEQKRIVHKVTYLLAMIDRLEGKKTVATDTLQSFATAAVVAITSTKFTENEWMMPPKTEVVTTLKVAKKPKKKDLAPLATLLSKRKSEASAKELWQLSGLEIGAFYRQLKTEMAIGWIEETHAAFSREKIEIGQQISELKTKLDWDKTAGAPRKWWESFELENRHRPERLVQLLNGLLRKKLTIPEFLARHMLQTTEVRTVTDYFPHAIDEAIESLLAEQAETES